MRHCLLGGWQVNKLGREILDAAARIIRPGVTTDEIDRVVHEYTIEHGAYPAPLPTNVADLRRSAAAAGAGAGADAPLGNVSCFSASSSSKSTTDGRRSRR